MGFWRPDLNEDAVIESDLELNAHRKWPIKGYTTKKGVRRKGYAQGRKEAKGGYTYTVRGKETVIEETEEARRKRVARARISHKDVKKANGLIARMWEVNMVKLTGGVDLNRDEFMKRRGGRSDPPWDVQAGNWLIDVKTVQEKESEKNQKVTLHDRAGNRKDNVVLGIEQQPGVKWRKGMRGCIVVVDLRGPQPVFYFREADYSGRRWLVDERGRPVYKMVTPEGGGFYKEKVPKKRPGYGTGAWEYKTMHKVTWEQLRAIFEGKLRLPYEFSAGR